MLRSIGPHNDDGQKCPNSATQMLKDGYDYAIIIFTRHCVYMENRALSQRKLYAMLRMGLAIDRAIGERSYSAKERAAKWAAAWGLLVGIQTPRVRLKPARDVMLSTPIDHEDTKRAPAGAPS
jgi:hypothetical protein